MPAALPLQTQIFVYVVLKVSNSSNRPIYSVSKYKIQTCLNTLRLATLAISHPYTLEYSKVADDLLWLFLAHACPLPPYAHFRISRTSFTSFLHESGRLMTLDILVCPLACHFVRNICSSCAVKQARTPPSYILRMSMRKERRGRCLPTIAFECQRRSKRGRGGHSLPIDKRYAV